MKRHGCTFALGLAILLFGVAATAEAAPLTLSFSGTVDLSGSAGAEDNPFSGFFTWDTTRDPFETGDPFFRIYPVEAYQLTFNGVVRSGSEAGVFVFNNINAFGTGPVDGLMFGTVVEENVTINGVTGDMFFFGALSGPESWDTLSLPTDYGFLSDLTTRFSGVSLEVPGGEDGGDANDVRLGDGSFAVTVPEPATLSLTVLGLAGVVARARRGRQRR
jgi:hypothetical protein